MKHLLVSISIVSLLLLSSIDEAAAQDSKKDTENFGGRSQMNGYSLSDFKDFEKNWRLVTVRFRKDTNELRWVFANEQAWKVLETGSTKYPDGAVFGKIGIATADDSQFASSAVPVGARRYQFMVRDAKKHADTGGWGYVLLDSQGKTFPENPQHASMACFACHKLVENRGQVFSQPFQLAGSIKSAFLPGSKAPSKISFGWAKATDLPEELRKLLPGTPSKIRQITDVEIRTHLFQGTLDEMRPTLEREAHEQKSPAALISMDGQRFSLVVPGRKDGCKEGRFFKTFMTVQGDSQSKDRVQTGEYCNP